MSTQQQYRGRRLGLTSLTVAASGLLALLIGVAFAVLLWAISDANSSTSARRTSRTALVEAGTMERLLLDVETGQRGFVITNHETFLQPWHQARSELPAAARRFTESATSTEQRRTAERIAQGVDSFLKDYSVPLVDMVRREALCDARPVQDSGGRSVLSAVPLTTDPCDTRFATTEEGRRTAE